MPALTNGTTLLEVFNEPPHCKNVWLKTRRNIARVTFNKTIEGRYRDGVDGYAEVGALLIYWEHDDEAFKQEVVDLERVLKNQYHFTTKIFGIPFERSDTALFKEIAEWAHMFNGPDKLSIIYYGGHANKGKSNILQLSRNVQDHIADGSEDRSEFLLEFPEITRPLRLPDTDHLLIVDCCFAAKAFSRQELGKRKFELLSSAPPSKEALGPAYVNSFTKNLTATLEELLEEKGDKGFTTSLLYRKLYFQQHDTIKPFLFDQSPNNYGRIWIKPLTHKHAQRNGISNSEKKSQVAVDIRLQLSRMPDNELMRELASNMQYLPHVKQMEFQHLHAPEQQLNEFMLTLRKIQTLKPLVRKLRQRLEEKRIKRKEEEGMAPSPIIRRASTLEISDKTKELYDWPGQLQSRSGNVTPKPRTPTSEDNLRISDHSIMYRVPVHTFGRRFSYAFHFGSLGPDLSKRRHGRGGFIVHQLKVLLLIWIRLAVILLVVPLRLTELLKKHLE
ncbi:hypothetical protein B0J12DRAFT_388924 [Macrophomina phaseolina]|uniref:Peptidase C14 caspase catalytic n=1 Tax=Macrophomina phaseolina TaxID=35725 RepID=A0ABQ8FSN8_9PEZI|nr:hypothetical protein B0J12DRAFT_388924 [Macrophomina phaseolina]